MKVSSKEKAIFTITLFALAAFVVVALGTSHPADWPFASGRSFSDVQNLCGPLGSWSAYLFQKLLGGWFAWLIPIGLLAFSTAIVTGKTGRFGRRLFKIALMVLLLNAFFAISSFTRELDSLSGWVGKSTAALVTSVLGDIGSSILIIAALLLIAVGEFKRMTRAASGLGEVMSGSGTLLKGLRSGLATGLIGLGRILKKTAAKANDWRRDRSADDEPEPLLPADDDVQPWLEAEETETPLPGEFRTERPALKPKTKRKKTAPAAPGAEPAITGVPIEDASLPDISLLEEAKGEDGTPYTPDRLKKWSAVLEEKLRNYNIEGRVSDVHHGPLITTFEFEPAPGVKIKDIVSRTDDLALALRARSLRLIAPIPGRAAVGIEIPNPETRTVRFREVLKEIPERLRVSGIMIALGVDVSGKPYFLNLCSAPHLLVAGTTGSGKSVCLNVIIASILFQHHPSEVKLLLVDPKMVEMNMYNDIPHLIHPVITDPKIAARAFSYLTTEMRRRNELFRESGVKNIESYNSKIALGRNRPEEGEKKLPYIVLIVDELGDLALAKGVDIETFLSRISNMARAVGIHMVVATQRPSVDVIVGKTKANFPTRIAFRVASKVDSRTILDAIGAEKLIGKGDMLHTNAKNPEPFRLHGGFLSEEELERIVAHWKSYDYEPPTAFEVFESKREVNEDEDRDPLFNDAMEVILRYKQGSTSLLQRKLHVGYARAARLLDSMEEAGLVGPPDGSKPREVLIKDGEELPHNRTTV